MLERTKTLLLLFSLIGFDLLVGINVSWILGAALLAAPLTMLVLFIYHLFIVGGGKKMSFGKSKERDVRGGT